MTNMYYDENPDSLHDIHELNVTLLGFPFTFLTDSGVFSKKMIDFGSQVLLNTLHFNKGERVLDLGCGYGPLGISLAKVQEVEATLVDINNRAIDLLKKMHVKTKLTLLFFNLTFMKTLGDHSTISLVTLLFERVRRLSMRSLKKVLIF